MKFIKRNNRVLCFWMLLFSSVLTAYSQVDLRNIEFTGLVHQNGKGIPGVPVSDGFNIVLTDAHGKYKLLSSATADFVFITIPAGYEIPYTGGLPRFYVPVTNPSKSHQTVNFELQKSTMDDNKHVVIAWADPQVYKPRDVEYCRKAAADLKDFVAQQYPKTPVHGIVCGDIVGDKPELYESIKEVVTSTTVPFFYIPGNHDLNLYVRSNDLAFERYKNTFGPDFYSFNRGKIHYVMLNDVFYTARSYLYIGYLPERQLNWLQQDLALVPAGSTVVVSMHIPTYSTESWKKEYNKESALHALQNRQALYEMLKPYNTHIISGHMHNNSNWVLSDSLYEHNQAAICGIFWQGPDCADGTPPGYGVYEADGDKLTWKYKSVGKPIDHQFRAYPVGSNPEKPDAVTALVWNYDPAWKVYWYEDGVKKGEMKQYVGHDPQTTDYIIKNKSKFEYEWIWTQESDHMFMAVPSSPDAKIRVEVIDRFGNVYSKEPGSLPDSVSLSSTELQNKIKGGWAGKTIGCTFGGPVEFQYNGMIIPDSVPIDWSDQAVKKYFDTFPGLYDDVYVNLTFMGVFERLGLDAPADSLALAFAHAGYPLWHANQVARSNILRGIMPPESGHWLNNPHADDIDFQIEADFAGLMSPGMPNTASAFCDKTGHIMNYGDGWYGGVFVSSMYTLAFISDDMEQVVKEALKTIPPKSTFYKCISDVLTWYRAYPGDWKRTWSECQKKWSNESGCPDGVFEALDIDAKMNSAYVVIGLLYGNKDFFRTMDIAARCGQDSDCNAATAAGVLGTMIGYDAIPAQWTRSLLPVQDIPFAHTPYSLQKVYEIGLKHALQVVRENGGSVQNGEVTVRCQKPTPVRYEQTFNSRYYPSEKIALGKTLKSDVQLDFEGFGVVVKGYVKSPDVNYNARVGVSLNGKLIETIDLPASDSPARKVDLFWKYQLPQKKNKLVLKWLNPVPEVNIFLGEAIIYGDLFSPQYSGNRQ